MENKTKLSKAELANKLIEALEDFGYEPRSYSGRGMYGKECVAVAGDEFEIGFTVAQIEDIEVMRQLHSIGHCCDSLGLGTVVYWPSLGWPEESD